MKAQSALMAIMSLLATSGCTGVCAPQLDDLEAQVRKACGPPAETYVAPRSSEFSWLHSEWVYDQTIIGFIDGRVAYVLEL